MVKRADGELELEVLTILWASDVALQPAEVRRRTEGNLAYTSIATVLTRLWEKGLVTRTQVGRAYAYSAAASRDEWDSRRMAAVLDEAPDHHALLAKFVGRLSKKDLAELRRVLDEAD